MIRFNIKFYVALTNEESSGGGLMYTQLGGLTKITLPDKETGKIVFGLIDGTDSVNQVEPGWTTPGTFSAEWEYHADLLLVLEGLHGISRPYKMAYITGNTKHLGYAYMSKGPISEMDGSDETCSIKCEFQTNEIWDTSKITE